MPTLKDYSVKFGRDPRHGLYTIKAIPYFYALINHNDVDWTANRDPADLSTFAVRCRANAVTSHYLRLEPDYNYKLIAIKYSVYYAKALPAAPLFDNTLALPVDPVLNDRYIAQATAHGWTAGITYRWNGTAWIADILYQYEWYENFNASSLYTENLLPGTPYSGHIYVSLSAQGSGSTTLFGGQNIQAINNTAAKIPLAVSCMQGYEYGYQALRCEYLLPMQGVLSFEFTNTHPTKELLVTAMLYGMKIRL